MCGVIGYIPAGGGTEASCAFHALLLESLVRGLHAAGLAQPGAAELVVTKGEPTAVIRAFDPSRPAIAHTRYSTSGDWHTPENNQPIVAGGLALAFNGVIHMGTKSEFERDFGVQCTTANDGEVFVRRVLAGGDPLEFIAGISGSFAGVWLLGGQLHVARNARRPLWAAEGRGGYWYASTRDIFRRAGFEDPIEVPAV